MMLDSSVWPVPSDMPGLSADEVHVWCAAVDHEASLLDRLQQLLSAEERAKANRFRLPKARAEFVVARGLLRIIVGRYLDTKPAYMQFCTGPHGKPALLAQSGQAALRFNVSHSGGFILYAVSRQREVGVDLERICSELAVEDLAARFFSPRENAALLGLPKNRRRDGFFACWTRKEAFLKAKGDGLSQPLDGFDVSLAPGEPAALLGSRSHARDVERWSIREVPSIPGYAGAVAGEGADWVLRCWSLRKGQPWTHVLG